MFYKNYVKTHICLPQKNMTNFCSLPQNPRWRQKGDGELLFYPCYHAFLLCLIVRDFGSSPQVSRKPKFSNLS